MLLVPESDNGLGQVFLDLRRFLIQLRLFIELVGEELRIDEVRVLFFGGTSRLGVRRILLVLRLDHSSVRVFAIILILHVLQDLLFHGLLVVKHEQLVVF